MVVAWQVTSEDGHVVSGAVTFSVGAPSVGGAACAATPEPPTSVHRRALGRRRPRRARPGRRAGAHPRRPASADLAWNAGFLAALLLAPLHELADDGRGLGGLTDWLAWINGVTRPASLLLLAAYAVVAVRQGAGGRVLPALALSRGRRGLAQADASSVDADPHGRRRPRAAVELGPPDRVGRRFDRGCSGDDRARPFAVPTLTVGNDDLSLEPS